MNPISSREAERPLRIGFLTTEYPTEAYNGGIGSYVCQMAHSLHQLGHSAFVLLAASSGPTLDWDGPIPIHRVRVPDFASRLPEPLGKGASLAFAMRLRKICTELKLDVLEAPEFIGLTAFLRMLKPSNLRVVVRLHTCSSIVRRINNSEPSSIRERLDWGLRDRLEKQAIVTADAVTAVSSAIVDETKNALAFRRSDFQVVPNSVNESAFSEKPSRNGHRPTLLFVGRLEWRKGPDLLIRALPALLESYPDLQVCFAGGDTKTGPERGSMMAYLKSLLPKQALSKVEFRGHLNAAQLSKAMQDATICVFPSRYEGLPMVCLEAMAGGKPIVTTSIPGFRDLILDGKTGLTAKEEDPESLASALIRMLEDASLRANLGTAAREFAHERFHGKTVAESMVTVYRNALDNA